MADVKKVSVYRYGAGEELVCVIDPESDTKLVFIPSPPTTTTQKINPRTPVNNQTAVRAEQSPERLEAQKAYCAEQKLVFICTDSLVAEQIQQAYEYMTLNERNLNVKKDRLVLKADAASMDAAQEAMDYLIDELDVEFEDEEIEEFSV